MSVDLFLGIGLLVIFATLLLPYFRNGPKNLPPGPWGLPIFGHLLFLGRTPHRTLMTWKKKYGQIIYCRMGSFPAVFLCDAKIIKQVFGMAEGAGRGDFDAILEKKERKGLIANEGLRQTEQRHFAMTTLKDFGVGRKLIEGHIQDALGQFLDKIKVKGENGRKAIDSCHIASSYVISSLYTILMSNKLSDAEVSNISDLSDKISELGSIIGQLAIFMPWMETLTKLVTFGQLSLIKGRQGTLPAVYRFMEVEIEKRKSSWVKGQPRDVIDAYLDMVDETKDIHSAFHPSQNSIGHFAGDLVTAGVHTTAVTLEWMFLYMATFPSIQRKLQEEIDLGIGTSRLPTLSDRPQMPYVDAAIYELLRLSSMLPLGLDHKCVRQITLQDYQIPKGTLIFGNFFGIHHEPEIWGEDVEEFNPERWLGEAGRTLKSNFFLVFSTGKRNCIGEGLAKDTLFIFITGIFQRFDVTFEQGCGGPGLEAMYGMTLSPKPFKITFTPRLCD